MGRRNSKLVDMEDRHKMAGAIFAYPMIENAIRGNRGRTIEQHGLAMGKLFSRFAKVAENIHLRTVVKGFTAEQMASVNPDNPYIGFPYTKLMNSNAFIDQAAAVCNICKRKLENWASRRKSRGLSTWLWDVIIGI